MRQSGAGVEERFQGRVVGVPAAVAHDDDDVAVPPDRLVAGERPPFFGSRPAARGKVPVLLRLVGAAVDRIGRGAFPPVCGRFTSKAGFLKPLKPPLTAPAATVKPLPCQAFWRLANEYGLPANTSGGGVGGGGVAVTAAGAGVASGAGVAAWNDWKSNRLRFTSLSLKARPTRNSRRTTPARPPIAVSTTISSARLPGGGRVTRGI